MACRGHRKNVPHTVDVITAWKWVVALMKRILCMLERRLDGSQNLSFK